MTTIPILFLFITLLCLIIFKLIQWIIYGIIFLALRRFWLLKRERKRIEFEKEHIREALEDGFLELRIRLGVQCPHNLGYWDYYATRKKRLRLPSHIVVAPARIFQGQDRTYVIYLRKEKLGEFFKLFKPHQSGAAHFLKQDVHLDRKKNVHVDRVGICCNEAFGYVVIEVFDNGRVIHVY